MNSTLIELFKISTPYILAFIVYLVWHIQKEKEVIANEAKNLLILLNEGVDVSSKLLKELNRITYKITPMTSPDEKKELFNGIEEYINLLDSKFMEVFNSLNFIGSAVIDTELYDCITDYLNLIEKILEKYYKKTLEETNISSLSEFKDLHYDLIKETREIKKVVLKHALFRKRYFLSLLKKSIF